MSVIAFDVDGTLISYGDKPRRDVIDILINLSRLGHRIIVHSGGGVEYAQLWVRRLFLDEFVAECRDKSFVDPPAGDIDVAFDDDLGQFGKHTIKV